MPCLFGLAYLVGFVDELYRFDSCCGLSGDMAGLAMSVMMACRASWMNELILLGLSG